MSNAVEGDAAHLEYAKWICATKRGFDSVAEAKAAATRSLERDASIAALYWHRCTACRRLHLTKKKRGSPLAKRSDIPTAGTARE